MDKKIIASILIVVGLLAITAGALLFFRDDTKQNSNELTNNQTEGEPTMQNQEPEQAHNQNEPQAPDKTLVVFFSAQNHTKNVANKIAANLDADLFEIEPVEPYTETDLDWTDSGSRVSKEHADPALQNIALKTVDVPNWNEYNTVFIGYPIWWGDSAWPVDSFVSQVDFSNKTVIPFCTSHSSGLGSSDTDLAAKPNNGNWQPGHRFSQDATDEEIKTWTNSL